MQKAKYEVVHGNKDVRYTAITTTRNVEDMVSILRDRFDVCGFPYKIIQTIGGERNEVYNNHKPTRIPTRPIKPSKKYIKIVDSQTNILYPHISAAARDTGLCRMSIYRAIKRKEHNYRFYLYKEPQETIY